MPCKRIFLILACFVLASLSGFELWCRFIYGPLTQSAKEAQDKYIYEDIHKRLFLKKRAADGSFVYQARQRHQLGDLSFPAHKKEGTKRIFVIGGSVVQDVRGDALLFSQALELSIPGQKFEVICCGLGAYDSYRDSLVQKEVLAYEPDLIILMSGNNEFLPPVKVNLLFFRVNALLLHLRSYRFMAGLIRGHIGRPAVSPQARLLNFEKNIETMAARAKKAGVPMALCTLPADLRDTPPLINEPPWEEKLFFAGWFAFDNADYSSAARYLQAFCADKPQDAHGHYLLARCYEARREYQKAREYYVKAVELDMPDGRRMTASRNELIRTICYRRDLILVDLEKLFMGLSSHGLIDSRYLRDHCHWWVEYNGLVLQEIVSRVHAYDKNHTQPVFSAAWDEKNLYWLQSRPLTEEGGRGRGFLKAIIAFSLIYNYHSESSFNEPAAAYLDQARQFDASIFDDRQWLKTEFFKRLQSNWWMRDSAGSLDTFWPDYLAHVGESLRRQGLYRESLGYFDQACTLQPGLWSARLGRAVAQYNLGRTEEAQGELASIEKQFPGVPLIKAYRRKFER